MICLYVKEHGAQQLPSKIKVLSLEVVGLPNISQMLTYFHISTLFQCKYATAIIVLTGRYKRVRIHSKQVNKALSEYYAKVSTSK